MKDEELIWYYSINEFPENKVPENDRGLPNDPNVTGLIEQERKFDLKLVNSLEVNVRIPADLKRNILDKLQHRQGSVDDPQLALGRVRTLLKAVAVIAVSCVILLCMIPHPDVSNMDLFSMISKSSFPILYALSVTTGILVPILLARFGDLQKIRGQQSYPTTI